MKLPTVKPPIKLPENLTIKYEVVGSQTVIDETTGIEVVDNQVINLTASVVVDSNANLKLDDPGVNYDGVAIKGYLLKPLTLDARIKLIGTHPALLSFPNSANSQSGNFTFSEIVTPFVEVGKVLGVPIKGVFRKVGSG